MWLRYYMWQVQIRSLIPLDVQAELLRLEAAPAANTQRLGEIYGHYFFGNYFSDDVVLKDLLWFGGLTLAMLPLVIAGGVWLARRLSGQIEEVALAAGEIAHGRFTARATRLVGSPPVLEQLTVDFNHMASQLEQYERELQASSAAIAHELRTPLTAAMGRLQGVRDGVFEADAVNLGMIHNQLSQLGKLVGDLHLLSLCRAGELHLKPSEFLLRRLLEERLSWYSHQLASNGMQVSLQVAGDVRVYADRDRLGQVISILLENGIRYAAAGQWLWISSTLDTTHFSLKFTDAGPGFSEEHLARVGERFWRAEDSRSRHAGGSGLGLAIARAICEAHAGQINIANCEGGGACFTVILPTSPF